LSLLNDKTSKKTDFVFGDSDDEFRIRKFVLTYASIKKSTLLAII